MTWVKLDDRLPDHPKMLSIGDAAFRLWSYCLCKANARMQGGFLPTRLVTVTAGYFGPPEKAEELAQELVDAGLWDEAEGGYEIHDYDEYQPKADGEEERKAKARERMQRVRERARTVREQDANGVREQCANSARTRSQPFAPPGPARPDPIPVPIVEQTAVPEAPPARTKQPPGQVADLLLEFCAAAGSNLRFGAPGGDVPMPQEAVLWGSALRRLWPDKPPDRERLGKMAAIIAAGEWWPIKNGLTLTSLCQASSRDLMLELSQQVDKPPPRAKRGAPGLHPVAAALLEMADAQGRKPEVIDAE